MECDLVKMTEENDDTPDLSIVVAKLVDSELPGAPVAFDPREADLAGAFVEDALDEDEALAAQFDLPVEER